MHDEGVTKKRAAVVRCAEACAFFNVRRLSRVLERHYSRALAPAELTASQFAILVAVAASQDPSITALGRTIGMSQSALSRQLTAMTRRGLVQVVSKEGRARRVRLATAGESCLRRALPRWQAAQDIIVGALGDDGWQQMLGGVRQLVATARAIRPPKLKPRPR